MPRYSFSARDAVGESVTGVRQSASAGQVAQELAALGMVPLKIKEYETPRSVSGARLRWFKPRVKTSELIVFSHQMTSLVRAGISAVRAVRTLGESSKNVYFAGVLADVAANLEAGADIASSLKRHTDVFGELFISLIHVGENTGRLEEAFKQISAYLTMEDETRKRIKSATRYPLFVLGAMVVAVVVLNLFVIPAFAGVFAKYGADLPWQTQAILLVSNLFVTYWPLGLLLFVAAGYFVRRSLRTERGRVSWHRRKLKVPIVGSLFERIYLARFCHTFAMVSRSGVALNQGLRIVASAIGNDYMAGKILLMRDRIERGENITMTAQSVQMFSPVVLQMMAVGEETGNMDELLEQAAAFYEEEVDYELKNLTDALEPLLISAIAGLVLIMALGVFLPLWDLSSVAR
ncbi:MAG: type II secretion system F family protein [Pseudomonadota bacterium]